MNIRLVEIPHHLGKRERPMEETGPAVLLAGPLVSTLENLGHKVSVERVACEIKYDTEHDAVLSINADASRVVSNARAAGMLPIVVTGNCATSLCALAGANTTDTAVLWFDAHGDVNTPETSGSGMLDGMPLAIACGRCYSDVWQVVSDRPVSDANVVLAGIREADDEEWAYLETAPIHVIDAPTIHERGSQSAFADAFADVAKRVTELFIHLDLDGVDPAEAPGVGWRTAAGCTEEQVTEMIRVACEHIPLTAASIAAYDPKRDDNGTTRRLAERLIGVLASAERRGEQ